MQNPLRRRAVAPMLLGALLAPMTLGQGPARPAAGQEDGAGQDDGAPEVVFAEMVFADALSRAERTGKILVILWVEGEDTRTTTAFRDGIFKDRAVRRWLAANATVVRIDGEVDKAGARSNLLPDFPAVDVIDLKRGGRIERLMRGSMAVDFLAAVYGAEDETQPLEKPSGADATEPFRWLAWANARYRSGDPGAAREAVEGYTWCLRRADDHRQDFRARYFEFLLKRIASAKSREPLAIAILNAERNILATRMRYGSATTRDVYELTRVDFWRRKELETRDLYIALGHMGEAQEGYRALLFGTVVPVLGRFRQYDEILASAGSSPVDLFRVRVAKLTAPDPVPDPAADVTDDGAQVDGAPVAERPMRFTVPDTRANIIDDASWVYEALLTAGRGADAKALFEYLGQTYPLGRTFGLFMERALRLELWSLAAEIADTGMSVVDARGQNRLRRLLGRIPAKTDDDGSDQR